MNRIGKNRMGTALLGAAALLLAAGCSLGRDNDTYAEAEAHQVMDVGTSTVLTYQPVVVKAEQSGTGAIYGGAVGATGAWAAGGSDPIIVGAALLGVAAGYLAEDLIASEHEGYTYVMQCEESCAIGRNDSETWAVTVAQDGEPFPIGQRIYVLEDQGTGVIRLLPVEGQTAAQ
jgi:outer membrane lipoprotein SlyB